MQRALKRNIEGLGRLQPRAQAVEWGTGRESDKATGLEHCPLGGGSWLHSPAFSGSKGGSSGGWSYTQGRNIWEARTEAVRWCKTPN